MIGYIVGSAMLLIKSKLNCHDISSNTGCLLL